VAKQSGGRASWAEGTTSVGRGLQAESFWSFKVGKGGHETGVRGQEGNGMGGLRGAQETNLYMASPCGTHNRKL
jgi:hypothetical protein